jgi:hypothetical protein
MNRPQNVLRPEQIAVKFYSGTPSRDALSRHYAYQNVQENLMDISPEMATHNLLCHRLDDERGRRAICGGNCEFYPIPVDFVAEGPLREIPLVDACRMITRGEYDRLLTQEQKDYIAKLFLKDRAVS